MGVTMDPEAFGTGAADFARNSDALVGHAAAVGDLAALRAAFAGAGETAWPALEARLTDLIARLDAAQAGVTQAGTVLRGAAGAVPTIDQDNANSMRR